MYMHILTRLRTQMEIHTYIVVRANTCPHTETLENTHTHTHTQTNTNTQTHTHCGAISSHQFAELLMISWMVAEGDESSILMMSGDESDPLSTTTQVTAPHE